MPYTIGVLPADIHAYELPNYTFGEHLVGIWNKTDDLNIVLTNFERLPQLQDVPYDELAKATRPIKDEQGILEACRQYYIELAFRLADIPIDSENIAYAHRIIGDLANARNLMVVNMGYEEHDDVRGALPLEELLGLQLTGQQGRNRVE